MIVEAPAENFARGIKSVDLSGLGHPTGTGKVRDIVDGKLGSGIWQRTKNAAMEIFERGRAYHLNAGLILVDTKYEFGVDKNGELMLIDEVHT